MAECGLEQWQDLSFDLMGLMIRTLTVTDRNAAKEILGISVPLLCACLGVETLSSENDDSAVREDIFSCQVDGALVMKSHVRF